MCASVRVRVACGVHRQGNSAYRFYMTFQRECRQLPSVVEMAALRQEHRYGLSCGKINKNTPNKTLYHVKLTDTAIRTLEAYQNLKVRDILGWFCQFVCVFVRVYVFLKHPATGNCKFSTENTAGFLLFRAKSWNSSLASRAFKSRQCSVGAVRVASGWARLLWLRQLL